MDIFRFSMYEDSQMLLKGCETEIIKAATDMIVFGTGYFQGGKHVPFQDVSADELQTINEVSLFPEKNAVKQLRERFEQRKANICPSSDMNEIVSGTVQDTSSDELQMINEGSPVTHSPVATLIGQLEESDDGPEPCPGCDNFVLCTCDYMPPACECGAHSVNATRHSEWCPLRE